MTEHNELLKQSITIVVEALKSGEITMKELIKHIVPVKEKKVKSKEEKQKYLKAWREKNKDYFRIRRANLKIKGVLEQPQPQDQHPSTSELYTSNSVEVPSV
jgi:hypothetical protein